MAENSPKQRKRRGPGRPFQKGQSGNPGGRPKMAIELRERADKLAPAAFKIIETLMTDADKDSVRLSAAVRVLQVAGVPMGEVKVEVNAPEESSRDAQGLPDADLDAELSTPESVN
jgi:Family of unknown function (DUF5681)